MWDPRVPERPVRRHEHPWHSPVTLVDSNLNSEKLTCWPRHTPIPWGKDSMVKYCSPGALLWQKSSSIHVWDSAHSKRHNECSNIQEKQDFPRRCHTFSIFQVTAKYSCRSITLSTAHLRQAMLYEPYTESLTKSYQFLDIIIGRKWPWSRILLFELRSSTSH